MPADTTIRLPLLDELARRWGEIEPLIAKATRRDGGLYLPADVLEEAARGGFDIWLVERSGRLLAVVVAGAVEFPRKRLLIVRWLAGRGLADWWPAFVDEMDRTKARLGCDEIRAAGRPGWVRFWRQRGVAVHVGSEIMIRR